MGTNWVTSSDKWMCYYYIIRDPVFHGNQLNLDRGGSTVGAGQPGPMFYSFFTSCFQWVFTTSLAIDPLFWETLTKTFVSYECNILVVIWKSLSLVNRTSSFLCRVCLWWCLHPWWWWYTRWCNGWHELCACLSFCQQLPTPTPPGSNSSSHKCQVMKSLQVYLIQL